MLLGSDACMLYLDGCNPHPECREGHFAHEAHYERADLPEPPPAQPVSLLRPSTAKVSGSTRVRNPPNPGGEPH